ncbi:hypothetical protein N9Q58_01045 [Polaribacter sp.]|nr:hypothetical protein [Polaribacter sp.]
MKTCKKKIFVACFTVLLISKCEAIFIEDISDETIVLLAPSNNVQIDSIEVQFNWKPLQDATTYEVQIAAPTFEAASQLVLDSIVSNTIISKSLDLGNYEWRVKGMNAEYSTNFTTNSFTIN